MSDSNSFNWREFYIELGKLGPSMLRGTPDDLKDHLEFESKESDAFWSEGLYGTLDARWEDGAEAAVRATLEVWLWNVQSHLKEILGPWSLMPWDSWGVSEKKRAEYQGQVEQMTLEPDHEIILQLTAAAQFGLRSESSPSLILQVAIFPERNVEEGMVVRAVSIPWRLLVERLRKDWSQAYLITPRKWEELVATAFEQDGFDEVIVTPASGDRGRDVIAVKKGIGTIRVLGSVKAYKPGHLVKHDDVRALMGVLLGDNSASKGIVTTTSDFAPGIATDPIIAPLLPYRMELMNGTALRYWLVSLAAK